MTFSSEDRAYAIFNIHDKMSRATAFTFTLMTASIAKATGQPHSSTTMFNLWFLSAFNTVGDIDDAIILIASLRWFVPSFFSPG